MSNDTGSDDNSDLVFAYTLVDHQSTTIQEMARRLKRFREQITLLTERVKHLRLKADEQSKMISALMTDRDNALAQVRRSTPHTRRPHKRV